MAPSLVFITCALHPLVGDILLPTRTGMEVILLFVSTRSAFVEILT